MILFVYGTLKKESKRSIMNYKDTIYLGEYTIYGYTLYKSPINNAPILVKSIWSCVKGELYKVTKETIKELDSREGYKGKWYNFIFSWYKRKYVGIHIQAYIWTFPTFFCKHIGSEYKISAP